MHECGSWDWDPDIPFLGIFVSKFRYFVFAVHTVNEGQVRIQYKMSGSNVCIPRNETVQPCDFQNRIIIFCHHISTFMFMWAIYIFPGSVCLFYWSQIGRPILGIYKSLTDTWIKELGTRLHSFHFCDYINRIFGTVQSVTCVGNLKVHKHEIILNFFLA